MGKIPSPLPLKQACIDKYHFGNFCCQRKSSIQISCRGQVALLYTTGWECLDKCMQPQLALCHLFHEVPWDMDRKWGEVFVTLVAGLLSGVCQMACDASSVMCRDYLLILHPKGCCLYNVTRRVLVTHPSRAFVGSDVGATCIHSPNTVWV